MLISEIQRFSTKDGGGIRTVIFVKGCPLDCRWCHNPETKSFENELMFYPTFCIGCRACEAACRNGCHSFTDTEHIFDRTKCTVCLKCAESCPAEALKPAAEEMSISEIADFAMRDRVFWGETGGVTISGGEPLAHEGTIELLKLLKSRGVSCILETGGYVPRERLAAAIPFTDLFYWDIKDGRRENHKAETGVYPERIIENLLFADSLGAKTAVRCIVVKGVNDSRESFENIAKTVLKLKNIQYIELIKYHAMGGAKQRALTGTDNTDKAFIPTEADLKRIAGYIKKYTDVNIKGI